MAQWQQLFESQTETVGEFVGKIYDKHLMELDDICKNATEKEKQTPTEKMKRQNLQTLFGIPKSQQQNSVQDSGQKNNTLSLKSEALKGNIKWNLLLHFRKEIQKLKDSLTNIDSKNISILEHKKSIWGEKMVRIKNIYQELAINHNGIEYIDKELELIEKQWEEAVNHILIKISVLKEEEKALVLEDIKIPIFNGDIEEWPSFKNMFEQFIHMRKLPAIEKLLRLKNHVRGEALKTIQNLSITENNYEVAWDILNQRYNQRILFTKQVDRDFTDPGITTEKTTFELSSVERFGKKSFYPDTPLPMGMTVSYVNLDMLYCYIRTHWVEERFEQYKSFFSNKEWENCWYMLNISAQDMITPSLPATIHNDENRREEIVSSIIDAITQSPLTQHPLAEFQDVLSSLRSLLTVLKSTSMSLLKGIIDDQERDVRYVEPQPLRTEQAMQAPTEQHQVSGNGVAQSSSFLFADESASNSEEFEE